ncbi:MAG: hypothetical protein A2Y24_07245 [Clostridiales bacterium GWE2_32_10]|nr:MAG: hypothetical protein A2Y24_07245 [Clostridiales bacterium GWE2_32_10]HBY20869.1 hypothetical protein [Clostridiales bacterium]
MNENLSLKARKLVKTIEDFMKTAKKMVEEGRITEDEYQSMIKKKVDFLNKYDDGKIIRFVIPDDKKAM